MTKNIKKLSKYIALLILTAGMATLNAADKKTHPTSQKQQHTLTTKHHRIKRIGYYPISPATQAAINSMRPHIQRKLLQRSSAQAPTAKGNKGNVRAL